MPTKKFFDLAQIREMLKPRQPYSSLPTYDELVNLESTVGRTIFGPIPAGRQREFFEHRKNIWIWHESWVNPLGVTENMTIRYEVRPAGVYKKTAGSPYIKIEGAELDNFRQAAKSYLELVKAKFYC